MKRTSLTLLTAGSLVVAGALAASPASAGGHGPRSPKPTSARTIADGLLTPLSMAIDHRGNALVSQNFAGELLRISKYGHKTSVATSPGNELGAVSTKGNTIYYATTAMGDTPGAKLYSKRKGHAPRQIADLRAFEEKRNPDQHTRYGFKHLPQSCASQFPDEFPASYTGIVDSHPYASLATHKKVYVADAAANAILSVKTRGGKPKVVATMPRVASVVTEAALEAEGLPTCAAGYTYYWEFVPTDVEMGRDGWLYVTSLPGGPEDASLGARGSVWKVNPHNGKMRKVAGGFVGSVDLALGPDGTIAVAELFGGADGTGQLTFLRKHSRWSLPLASPGAVEWTASRHHSKLYVTTNAFVPDEQGAPQATGKLKVLSFGKHRH
jgi:hypothetical protein